jgi:hypothetical protein
MYDDGRKNAYCTLFRRLLTKRWDVGADDAFSTDESRIVPFSVIVCRRFAAVLPFNVKLTSLL